MLLDVAFFEMVSLRNKGMQSKNYGGLLYHFVNDFGDLILYP